MKVTVERQHIASPESVFAKIADLSAIAKFVGMTKAQYLPDETPRVGATFATATLEMFRKPEDITPFLWTVTDYDPPRHFRAQMNESGGSIEFRIEPSASGGSRILMTEDNRPDSSDHLIDKVIFHLMELIPPLARRGSTADANNNINRL